MGGKYHKKICFKGDCFTKWELPKYNLKIGKEMALLERTSQHWPMAHELLNIEQFYDSIE